MKVALSLVLVICFPTCSLILGVPICQSLSRICGAARSSLHFQKVSPFQRDRLVSRFHFWALLLFRFLLAQGFSWEAVCPEGHFDSVLSLILLGMLEIHCTNARRNGFGHPVMGRSAIRRPLALKLTKQPRQLLEIIMPLPQHGAPSQLSRFKRSFWKYQHQPSSWCLQQPTVSVGDQTMGGGRGCFSAILGCT